MSVKFQYYFTLSKSTKEGETEQQKICTTHNGLSYIWDFLSFYNPSVENSWVYGHITYLNGPTKAIEACIFFNKRNESEDNLKLFERNDEKTIGEKRKDKEEYSVIVWFEIPEKFFDWRHIVEINKETVADNMFKVGRKLMETKLYTPPTDGSAVFKIMAGEEKKMLYCNPIILTTNSQYFEDLLKASDGFTEIQENTLDLTTYTAEVVETAIYCLHGADIKEINTVIAEEVAELCALWQLPTPLFEGFLLAAFKQERWGQKGTDAVKFMKMAELYSLPVLSHVFVTDSVLGNNDGKREENLSQVLAENGAFLIKKVLDFMAEVLSCKVCRPAL